MRLFIAINFADSTRQKLFSLCDELRLHSEQGRFCLPENLHLTLAFLGECNATQVITAKSVLDTITFRPFGLTVERIGRFKRSNGDTWWAGLRVSEPLSNLQSVLSGKLTAKGFALEDRKYKPHITLGRDVITDMKPHKIDPFGETVSSISLMKSEQNIGITKYTALHDRKAII